jgi:hypothetical protein
MTRYELLDRIGVGGMAEIFRARAIAGGGFEKPVAIKRILPHLCEDERFVNMLIAEANTLSQLRHRNIVQIFDVGLGSDGQYFLVMEFVNGSDLRALFDALEKRGKRLPLHLSLHVAAEICDALDFAHQSTSATGQALRLVHRDVSPSNVLLSRVGEVKLTDFGIAKRMEEATGHHGVRGKFAYISPEQAVNGPVDARSDVFSLGIVLFELVTGRRLFSRLSDLDALEAARTGRVPGPREFDPAMIAQIDEIIRRATAREPDQRYPTAAAFGAALRDCRYSIVTTAGEPAKELAKILAGLFDSDNKEQDASHDERTVVRIRTAAGFTGLGLEQRIIDGSGFEDEDTRAMSGEEVRRLIGADSLDEHQVLTQLLDPAPVAPEGETNVVAVSAVAGRPDTEVATVPLGFDRFATPTLHDALHARQLSEDAESLNVSTDLLGKLPAQYMGLPKRKAIVLASALAVLLGIVAFVIAGRFLRSRKPRPVLPQARITAVDAGPAAADRDVAPSGDASVGPSPQEAGEPSVILPRDEIETLLAPDAGAPRRREPARNEVKGRNEANSPDKSGGRRNSGTDNRGGKRDRKGGRPPR